jgi:hypothetical protein
MSQLAKSKLQGLRKVLWNILLWHSFPFLQGEPSFAWICVWGNYCVTNCWLQWNYLKLQFGIETKIFVGFVGQRNDPQRIIIQREIRDALA